MLAVVTFRPWLLSMFVMPSSALFDQSSCCLLYPDSQVHLLIQHHRPRLIQNCTQNTFSKSLRMVWTNIRPKVYYSIFIPSRNLEAPIWKPVPVLQKFLFHRSSCSSKYQLNKQNVCVEALPSVRKELLCILQATVKTHRNDCNAKLCKTNTLS